MCDLTLDDEYKIEKALKFSIGLPFSVVCPSPQAVDLWGELIERIIQWIVQYKVNCYDKKIWVKHGSNLWHSAQHRPEGDAATPNWETILFYTLVTDLIKYLLIKLYVLTYGYNVF